MSLEAISLTNFRSYTDRSFRFGQGINLVVGPNASGKTNLLESVFVLAVTKSFRAKDNDLVRHGQSHFRLMASGKGVEYALSFTNKDRREKRVTHNGAKKALSHHVGKVGVVLFEPNDLEMVGGVPEARRRYLDYVLCQTSQGYMGVLSRYRRVLRQRNALLADFNTQRISAEIFAWDIKLTELASEIYFQRKRLLGFLEPLAAEFYEQISRDAVDLRFKYLPSIEINEGNYGEGFLRRLAENLPRDLAAGFTTVGPHREDFGVSFGRNSVLSVASRGEVRTVVLAMKLAELKYNNEATGQKPMLLLDDVFSELDYGRRQDLLVRLRGYQCIITTTEADSIKPQIKEDYQLIETARGEEA